MVVGLFGILKAGGAYVFLDPAYPKERLIFMLEETIVPVLLTQQRLVEGLPDRGTRGLPGLVGDHSTKVVEPSQPCHGAEPSVCDVYPGSTGRPKV